MKHFSITIETNEGPADIEGTYTTGVRARTNCRNEDAYPGEPPEFELQSGSLYDEDGNEIRLGAMALDELAEDYFDDIHEALFDYFVDEGGM